MRRAKEHGFSLVELLTVVVIIGVLAKLSLVLFQQYKTRGLDISAKEDLRTIVLLEEALFSDNELYSACASTAACATVLPDFRASDGVMVRVTTPSPTRFVGTAYHPSGLQRWRFDSSVGLIESQ